MSTLCRKSNCNSVHADKREVEGVKKVLVIEEQVAYILGISCFLQSTIPRRTFNIAEGCNDRIDYTQTSNLVTIIIPSQLHQLISCTLPPYPPDNLAHLPANSARSSHTRVDSYSS